jgi:hypothetical protein
MPNKSTAAKRDSAKPTDPGTLEQLPARYASDTAR